MVFSNRERIAFKDLYEKLPEGSDSEFAARMINEAARLNHLPTPMILPMLEYMTCFEGAIKPKNWETALDLFDEAMQNLGFFKRAEESTYNIIKDIFIEGDYCTGCVDGNTCIHLEKIESYKFICDAGRNPSRDAKIQSAPNRDWIRNHNYGNNI